MTKHPNHIKTVAQIFSVTLIFLFSLGFSAAYLHDFFEWMDHHDKTGIVILVIGTLALSVLFFTTKNKRN